ncbi:MAG: polysaccharide biosynthesis tyrosine autokinase [Bacteroidales bacterium]|nr:polysaccharide biosynthesis tyrosine autokinase [Bacteroidales bacterium]
MNTRQTYTSIDPYYNDGIDYKRYFSLFLSNWHWFAISFFITISIAYGINRWSEEIYTVSSTLLVKDDQLGSAGSGMTNIFPGIEAFRSQQNLKNEIGILKSYKLNFQTIENLKDFHVEYFRVGKRGLVEIRTYNTAPFIVKYESLEEQIINKRLELRIISTTEYILIIDGEHPFKDTLSFGEEFDSLGFKFSVFLRYPDKYNFKEEGYNRFHFKFLNPASLANQYRRRLSVVPVEEEASLVALSISGSVAAQEADYLNKLMEEYLQYGLDFKNITAEQTIGFIEEQLGTISDSLSMAENDLESYRLKNKLIDISREGLIIQNKLEQIDSEQTNLLVRQNYYTYLRRYLETKKETGDIISPSVIGISDQILIRLVDELSALQKQREQLAMNFLESAEPLNIFEANIVATKQALRENIENGLRTIENTLNDTDKRLKEIEKEVLTLPSKERQLIKIQRQFDINNTVYNFLLEKRAEAGIAKASNVPDNRIIDKADIFNSTRIKPKTRQNYMMALVLGFFFPVLGIVLIDMLNNKIIDKNDIGKVTNAPIIGFISHNSYDTEIPVSDNPGSTLSESFRSVRTNLKYFLKDINDPVISVTSTITAEGKTFISTNIAGIIASLGKKVLLIGLDLRKPRTHKILNIDNNTGISNYLTGDIEMDEIIKATGIENLWYAPSGPIPPNPAELIESKSMKDFISDAKNKFDYIVIDTPPVAVVTDALLLSSFTDLYIFVVRQRYSSRNTLGLIEELYRNENIKKLGILVNDISLTGYYGYGLRYGYSGGYGYSYGYNYYGDIYARYGYSTGAKGYYSNEEA